MCQKNTSRCPNLSSGTRSVLLLGAVKNSQIPCCFLCILLGPPRGAGIKFSMRLTFSAVTFAMYLLTSSALQNCTERFVSFLFFSVSCKPCQGLLLASGFFENMVCGRSDVCNLAATGCSLPFVFREVVFWGRGYVLLFVGHPMQWHHNTGRERLQQNTGLQRHSGIVETIFVFAGETMD